jgi:hypothetical protein
MSSKVLLGILLAVLQLSLMQSAQAIMITLDDPAPTVIRPTTGFTEVNFTGHIDLSDGYEPGSIQASTLVNTLGDQLDSMFPMPRFDAGQFNVAGILFSVLVSAEDALGLYRFVDLASMSPVFIRYFECPVGSTTDCNSSTVNYSLNIVDGVNIPEPLSLALLAVGLLALCRAVRSSSAHTHHRS